MKKNDDIFSSEKTLHVLREIERNPKITQRDLSGKLQISLGRINFFINALVQKGIIEITNFKNSKNKLAYMYLLTPQGIRIKIQLTRKFFIWKTQEFEKLKKELENFRREIKPQDVNTRNSQHALR